jgi:hypothetical protein
MTTSPSFKYICDKRCDPRLIGDERVRSAESTEIIPEFLFEFLANGARMWIVAVKFRERRGVCITKDTSCSIGLFPNKHLKEVIVQRQSGKTAFVNPAPMMKVFIVLQKGFHSEIDAGQQGGFVQRPEYLEGNGSQEFWRPPLGPFASRSVVLRGLVRRPALNAPHPAPGRPPAARNPMTLAAHRTSRQPEQTSRKHLAQSVCYRQGRNTRKSHREVRSLHPR